MTFRSNVKPASLRGGINHKVMGYRLRIWPEDHKCMDSEGNWDKTWDTTYAWAIIDDNGIEVQSMDGYMTEQRAMEDGERALKKMEERV